MVDNISLLLMHVVLALLLLQFMRHGDPDDRPRPRGRFDRRRPGEGDPPA